MKFPVNIQEWINPTIGCTIVCLLLCLSSYGQSQTALEERRKRLIQEIKATTHQLNKTKKDKATTLKSYLALQTQIKKREQLVETLRSELQIIDTNLSHTYQTIDELNADISRLQEEYAKMARFAYRQKVNSYTLFFIFSAHSINDAIRRWRYLTQYDEYRQKQAVLIGHTQKQLTQKLLILEQEKQEKQDLLLTHEEQQEVLSKDLKSKNKALKRLKSSEAKLINNLAVRQEEHANLNRSIERMIRLAMAERKKAARSANALSNAPRKGTIDANAKLSGHFQLNKGKLPWPVQNGWISRPFGEQAHEKIKTILIKNNGIDIKTQKNAEVKAVFEGKVIGIKFVPGYQNMLILQHGNYYTVYSNLEEVYVRRNESISTGQVIGKVDAQKAEVHFEVWKDKNRLNPVHWIRKF